MKKITAEQVTENKEDSDDDKYYDQAILKDEYGIEYFGEYIDLEHKIARFEFDNGDTYEGEIKDGKKHGKGTYTWSSGDSYEGEWNDGKKHGQGTCTYANRGSYEGLWKDDKFEGKGTLTYAYEKIIGSANFTNGAINNIENLRYVKIDSQPYSHFIYQDNGKLYYQKINAGLSAQELEEIYEKKEGTWIDEKSYKRLPGILMQLCSPYVAIQDNNYKEIHNAKGFQDYLEKIKKDSKATGEAVVNNVEIPGHTFTVLAEAGKVTIYDNGGLEDNSLADYFNAIKNTKDDIEYLIIKCNNKIKFSTDKKVEIKLIPDIIECRNQSDIINQKINEIIKKGDKNTLIAKQYKDYRGTRYSEDYLDIDSSDEGRENSIINIVTKAQTATLHKKRSSQELS